IKAEHPEKTIWSYTGYIVELLLMLDDNDPRREFLDYIDVLIDGQFIDEERDESDLKVYRGSSNQRLIDVQKTLETNNTVLHEMESYR
ncbi:MAG TPA: 4Fe-4S cluster-binding domain-containing protein, partial [Erysipelothrix sp.]|nr:4Fe-4S cluster-binding domain-containing protein [Erysipelothrix sp.]